MEKWLNLTRNQHARPMRSEARGKLLSFIAKARSWLEEILSDPTARIEAIAARKGMPEGSARSILSLAFLAPSIVKGAVAGTLPRGFGVSRLIDLPAIWTAQLVALRLAWPAQTLVTLIEPHEFDCSGFQCSAKRRAGAVSTGERCRSET